MRELDAFAAPGRFYKGNLHTHSTRSDAAKGPEEVCAIYRDGGYDFLALTDHFMAKFGFPIVDTRDYRTNRFTTIIGAEVHAPMTTLNEVWHVLAVNLPLDFPPTAPGEEMPQLAARCVAAGAFVALAHPGWYSLGLADAAMIPDAHAVEIYNHTSAVRTDRGDGAYLLDQLLAQGRRLTACATDDAHFHCDDWFGGWVMVKSDSLEPEALTHALKAGRYYSSQGPEIHELSVGPDAIEIACSPANAIMVLGRGSRAAQLLGTNMTRATLPLGAVAGGGFGRVVVVDRDGRKAWSNPFWCD